MSATAVPDADAVHALVGALPDPEIPVVSIAELGILRAVRPAADGAVEVVITPTYSGCPAMDQIEDDVRALLRAHGLAARVTRQLAPAWSTAWIAPEAREKLRAFGIAPPARGAFETSPPARGAFETSPPARGAADHTRALRFARHAVAPAVPCPCCGSLDTTETSAFGSTACKSLHRCLSCLEPFDYFKPY